MINFVSNLPKDLRSGGFSAMNVAALTALSKVGRLQYAGPINPPSALTEKTISRARRALGGRGDFFFFSSRRLAVIAAEVERACDPSAGLDFFHGFTPWIATRPGRPYVAWSDCTFRDYIEIYHRREQFRSRDLERIEHTEAGWLSRAERVLFTSEWARQRAIAAYRLDPTRSASVGIFGEADVPARDAYAGGKTFVFVSTDFEAKGGPIVLAAYRMVRAQDPEAKLMVVGDRPSAAGDEPGVEFCGFLRKESPQDAARFNDILGTARAVVHPTQSDIAPLLLIEAGYFGCPAISTRRFAIPEIVADGRTGLLLDDPGDATAVAAAMMTLLRDDGYQAMRRAGWITTRQHHTKVQFEARIAENLMQLLPTRDLAAS